VPSAVPARWSRTAELVKDGDDTFALIVPLGGVVMRSQRGQEVDAKPGEAVCISTANPAASNFESSTTWP
jgi:hypothetical protein